MANEVVEKALHDTIKDFVNVIRKHVSIYRTKIQYQEAMINKRREFNLPTEEDEQLLQGYKDAAAAIMCLEEELKNIEMLAMLKLAAKKSFINNVNESLDH